MSRPCAPAPAAPGRTEGPGSLARDVMISDPKTLPVDATVADARDALADDHVHLILVVDDGRLVGTATRADLPASAPGGGALLPWTVLAGRAVLPGTPADEVRASLVRTGSRRLAVVDDDQALLGLVCLKRSRTGFCSDADVASRAAGAMSTTTEGCP